ncbi:MAG: tyrosine-protein phosphatase [Chitinophagaceae bacterium]
MFSFFNKKSNKDFSFLGVDMHNHLLPGLDDGLQTMEQTLAFVQQMKQLGYKKIICTPHILPEVHNNTYNGILQKLDEVKNALSKANIDMPIEAAAEYMVGLEFAEALKQNQPLLTFGKNYILIEMSFAAVSQNIVQVVFDLLMKGYKPILAHPERYSYYHRNFDVYEEFIGRGCLLQVNLLSLTGFYGKPVLKTAERLISNKMVSFLGTDMHHEGHLNMTKNLVQSSKFHNLIKNLDLLNNTL